MVKIVNRSGYSLMELVVAMLLSSIVLSNVYFFWKYMDKHVITYSNKAMLQKENDRIIHQITSAIRQSSGIIKYNQNSINFTDDKNEDTVSFSFSNDSLYRNGKSITILSKGIIVKNFEIKNLTDDPQNALQHIFLEFTLVMKNQKGDESEARLSVRTKRPAQQSDHFQEW